MANRPSWRNGTIVHDGFVGFKDFVCSPRTLGNLRILDYILFSIWLKPPIRWWFGWMIFFGKWSDYIDIPSVHIYIYLCCRKYHGRWRMTTWHGQNDPGFFCPIHGCTTPSLCQSKHLGYSKSCWTYVNRHIRGLVVSFWGCFSILLVEEILHHLRCRKPHQ